MIIAQEVNTRIVNTQGSVPASLLALPKPLEAAAAGGAVTPPAAAPGGVDEISPASLGITQNPLTFSDLDQVLRESAQFRRGERHRVLAGARDLLVG